MEFVDIIIFGDSLSYGIGDYELGGWVNRLRLYFDNNDNRKVNIYNLSIPGEITKETLSRFKPETNFRYNKCKKTFIVFAIGINDTQNINGQYRVPIEQFSYHIKSLAYTAKKFTNNVLFIGLTKVDELKVVPTFWNKHKSYFNERILKFDHLIEAICQKENMLYLKVYDVITTNDLLDGLHPNNTGHQKLYNAISNKILAMLNSN